MNQLSFVTVVWAASRSAFRSFISEFAKAKVASFLPGSRGTKKAFSITLPFYTKRDLGMIIRRRSRHPPCIGAAHDHVKVGRKLETAVPSASKGRQEGFAQLAVGSVCSDFSGDPFQALIAPHNLCGELSDAGISSVVEAKRVNKIEEVVP